MCASETLKPLALVDDAAVSHRGAVANPRHVSITSERSSVSIGPGPRETKRKRRPKSTASSHFVRPDHNASQPWLTSVDENKHCPKGRDKALPGKLQSGNPVELKKKPDRITLLPTVELRDQNL